ncbi:Uncharacterised protein [Klebsiella pneumoniae]|nr:Uncharacterised protein [Klebsiella pneumoniae]
MFFMPPERSHDKPAAYQTGRQERSLFSFLNCATLYQIEARKAKTGDQNTKFVTRLFPLQHQRYDDAGNDNPCNATPETQFIRRDINQDKGNGQDSPHRAGTG